MTKILKSMHHVLRLWMTKCLSSVDGTKSVRFISIYSTLKFLKFCYFFRIKLIESHKIFEDVSIIKISVKNVFWCCKFMKCQSTIIFTDNWKFLDWDSIIRNCFKISEIQGCKLKRIGDLSFDFYAGGCNTFPFGIMLCFHRYADKECHS